MSPAGKQGVMIQVSVPVGAKTTDDHFLLLNNCEYLRFRYLYCVNIVNKYSDMLYMDSKIIVRADRKKY